MRVRVRVISRHEVACAGRLRLGGGTWWMGQERLPGVCGAVDRGF